MHLAETAEQARRDVEYGLLDWARYFQSVGAVPQVQIEGDSTAGLIEAGRPCVDIAQQLHAVEKAVSQAKKTLIQDHIDHCLEQALGPVPRDRRGPVDEFKAITKYL